MKQLATLCLTFLLVEAVLAARLSSKQGKLSTSASKQTEDEVDMEEEDDMYNPREALLKHLLSRAGRSVPPPPQYLPINVQVKLRPLSITSVCTKTYQIQMPTLEMYNWTDPRLTWNTSDFGGIQYIDLAAKDIWMPDIAVWQSPESTPMQSRPKEYHAVVTSDGNVLYIPISELSIHCDADPWKQHNKQNNGQKKRQQSRNNNSTAKRTSRTREQNEAEINQSSERSESSDWTSEAQSFLCEFDQGPWIYDLSVVDVIPVSTGTLFSEHNETEHEEEAESEETQPPPMTPKQAQRGVVRAAQQFPAEDFDATADLSWFDGNELYDIGSFTAERFIERYTSFPVDWPSIHYRLVVKVNSDALHDGGSGKHKSKKNKHGDDKHKKKEKEQQQAEDTDDDDEDKNSDNDD